VLLFADRNHFAYGAIKVTEEQTRVYKLGELTYMVCTGEGGDVNDFAQWASANLRLYKTRNGYELSPESVHHWLRQSIANRLRSENFWRVNLIVGGWDPYTNRSFLGSIDYLGNAVANQNFLFKGLSGQFCLGILDSLHKSDMTETEGLDAIRKCIAEVHRRVIISITSYDVLIISKKGVNQMTPIGASEIAALASAGVSVFA